MSTIFWAETQTMSTHVYVCAKWWSEQNQVIHCACTDNLTTNRMTLRCGEQCHSNSEVTRASREAAPCGRNPKRSRFMIRNAWTSFLHRISSFKITYVEYLFHQWPPSVSPGASIFFAGTLSLGFSVSSLAVCFISGRRLFHHWPPSVSSLATVCFMIGPRLFHHWPPSVSCLPVVCFIMGCQTGHCMAGGCICSLMHAIPDLRLMIRDQFVVCRNQIQNQHEYHLCKTRVKVQAKDTRPETIYD